MKYCLTILFQCLLFILVRGQDLPSQTWQHAGDYTYMYFPKSLKNGSTFHIQSNQHFMAFDYAKMQLQDLRLISNAESDERAVHTKLPFLPLQEYQNLLEIALVYKGITYNLVHGPNTPSSCQLVESGTFFQRRNIVGLQFAKGAPQLNASLEIASWPDALSFVLKTNHTEELADAQLLIRLKSPKGFLAVADEGRMQLVANGKEEGFIVTTQATSTLKQEKETVVISKEISETGKFQLAFTLLSFTNAAHKDKLISSISPLKITAKQEEPTLKSLKIDYSNVYNWYQISLTNQLRDKEGIERIKLTFKNDADFPKTVRLNFSKAPVPNITGVSAMLTDENYIPIGLPVQLSKNWHNKLDHEFKGPWFRVFTMLTIPANKTVEIGYTSVIGYWGNLPAASHAQLSLIGYSDRFGSNQLWEQSALGAWGESICYEPDGGLASTMVTDVRPLLIKSTKPNLAPKRDYAWTPNVGGGDFFRFYNKQGDKIPLKEFRAYHKRYCPNLTEVTYTATTAGNEAKYALTTSIYQSDDYLRAIYKIKFKVIDTLDFNRLVVAQFGSDTYQFTNEKTFAFGDELGLITTWQTQPGGNTYKKLGVTTKNSLPWVSMHNAVNPYPDTWGAWANRGLIVREWAATVGGKMVSPHFAEYGTEIHNKPRSLLELNLPKGINRLFPGDSIVAVLEFIVLPQEAKSYYGSNQLFTNALQQFANSWELVFREATKNKLKIEAKGATVLNKFPIVVHVNTSKPIIKINGGVGYMPITFTGVEAYDTFEPNVFVNESKVDFAKQQVHGNDYWQADYNSKNKTWDLTFIIPFVK